MTTQYDFSFHCFSGAMVIKNCFHSHTRRALGECIPSPRLMPHFALLKKVKKRFLDAPLYPDPLIKLNWFFLGSVILLKNSQTAKECNKNITSLVEIIKDIEI